MESTRTGRRYGKGIYLRQEADDTATIIEYLAALDKTWRVGPQC